MKITVGICGGIAAYKVASLVSLLKKNKDIEIKVIMTKSATKFITPLTLEVLSKNKVVVDMFEEDNCDFVGHIKYGQESDLVVVVPATANMIGKVANGIADDMLSSTIIASTSKVLFVPSMNEHMYSNKIVQDNIEKLKKYGYEIMEPIVGELACGTSGIGKMPKTMDIASKIYELLKKES